MCTNVSLVSVSFYETVCGTVLGGNKAMGQYFVILQSLQSYFTYLKLQVCRVDRGCRCTDTHNIANRGTVAPFHCECAKKGGILCTLLFPGFVCVKQMILPLSSPGNFLSELGIMII
jgi:hypothetical protein